MLNDLEALFFSHLHDWAKIWHLFIKDDCFLVFFFLFLSH